MKNRQDLTLHKACDIIYAVLHRETVILSFANKLGMQDMRHVYVKMHMRYGGCAAYKQHRKAFYKSFHQLIWPSKSCVSCGAWSKILNKIFSNRQVALSYPRILQRWYNHLLYLWEYRHRFLYYYIYQLFIAYNCFKIIPVPFMIGGSIL